MLTWRGKPLTRRSAYVKPKPEPHPLQKHLALLADAVAIPSKRTLHEARWDVLDAIAALPMARYGTYPKWEWC